MIPVNTGKFQQFVLDKEFKFKQPVFQGLTISKALEGLLFLHALSVISSLVKHQAMKVKVSYTTGNLTGLVLQSVSRA